MFAFRKNRFSPSDKSSPDSHFDLRASPSSSLASDSSCSFKASPPTATSTAATAAPPAMQDRWASATSNPKRPQISPIKRASGTDVLLDILESPQNLDPTPPAFADGQKAGPTRPQGSPLTAHSRLPLVASTSERSLTASASHEKRLTSPANSHLVLDPLPSRVATSLDTGLPDCNIAHLARRKIKADELSADVANLKATLSSKEDELQAAQYDIAKYLDRERQLQNTNAMAMEEIAALQFTVSILEQKVVELEEGASVAQIEKNEALAYKAKKYKAAINKVNREKGEYEARANAVIQQMNEQMSSLQTVAMERIETLERELMESRRENETLKTKIELLGDQLQCAQAKLLRTPPHSRSARSTPKKSPAMEMVDVESDCFLAQHADENVR